VALTTSDPALPQCGMSRRLRRRSADAHLGRSPSASADERVTLACARRSDSGASSATTSTSPAAPASATRAGRTASSPPSLCRPTPAHAGVDTSRRRQHLADRLTRRPAEDQRPHAARPRRRRPDPARRAPSTRRLSRANSPPRLTRRSTAATGTATLVVASSVEARMPPRCSGSKRPRSLPSPRSRTLRPPTGSTAR
jgi:hypothetical protein